MDSLNETLTLEELVASVQTSQHHNQGMTMHHLEPVSAVSTDGGMTVPTVHTHHSVGVADSLSPSSTDTSIEKHTGRVKGANFLSISKF